MLILIHVIDLKKVICTDTKIGVVLFLAQFFLFWASPPCQGIRTLQFDTLRGWMVGS